MGLIEECSFEHEDSYGAIYQEGTKQRIITINNLEPELLEEGENYGVLEERHCGIELEFEKVFFSGGKANIYQNECESFGRNHWISREADLREFAKEFKFAFETNPKLKKYLPTVFKELMQFM